MSQSRRNGQPEPQPQELNLPRVVHVASPDKLHFAREQRRKPTRAEEALWQALRGGALGARFRRQHPIGDFVLDFYCAEAKLAVEVDGSTHDERPGYDGWRDSELQRRGIRTVRFASDVVESDLAGVLRRLRASLPPIADADTAL